MNRTILTALIFLFVTSCGIPENIKYPYLSHSQNIPDVTAHRGCSSSYPENTMIAIRQAIEARSDFVEIDIRQTKDGKIILMHDSNLSRICGLNRNIRDVKWNEIENIDVGSIYSQAFKAVRIPTLEEVLNKVKGRIRLNIELKVDGRENGMISRLIGLIEKTDFVNDCIITSSDYEALIKIKSLNKNIKTGFIAYVSAEELFNREAADLFSIHMSLLSSEVIRYSHSMGKEIHVWTVNDQEEMEQCLLLGVDNIITDYPFKLKELIYHWSYETYLLIAYMA